MVCLLGRKLSPAFPNLVLGLQGKVVVAERSHTGTVLEELQPLGGKHVVGQRRENQRPNVED